MKKILQRNGACFLILSIFVTVLVFVFYVYNTSVELPEFSDNRKDWNDMANFASSLATPFIAIVAAFLLWKQIEGENDVKKLEIYLLELEKLEPKFKKIFHEIVHREDINFHPDPELQTTLNRYNIVNQNFNEIFTGTASLGMNTIKDRMDNLIMDGLKGSQHLHYNRERGRYEENNPHIFGLARTALRVWVQNTPNQRVHMNE